MRNTRHEYIPIQPSENKPYSAFIIRTAHVALKLNGLEHVVATLCIENYHYYSNQARPHYFDSFNINIPTTH